MQRYPVPCTPPFYARGGHAQTVLGHVLPCSAPRIGEVAGSARIEVALDDGDRLVVVTEPGTSGVRVLIFHGLSGDCDAGYVRDAAAVARARGHSIWAVNHRGCGEGRGLARGTYHSGRWDDMAAVLAASRARDPRVPCVVVGFSLSGNIALLLAGAHREHQPDAIVALNPPVDLASTSALVSQGFSRVYDLRFVRRLVREIRRRERAGLLEGRREIPILAKMRDLDERVTAPLCGFTGADDYYERCSALPHLDGVGCPTVIVTSDDDPFVDASVYDGAALSPRIHLHREPVGGHLGYVASDGLLPRSWLDGCLGHYLDESVGALRAE